MDLNIFDNLPGDAPIWIYSADRPIDPAHQTRMLEALSKFFSTWQSHGRVLTGRATIAFDRFLIVAGYLPEGDPSGCGIDAMVHELQRLASEYGYEWVSPLDVHFRTDDGSVAAASRPEFRRLVRSGRVNGSTVVFDTSIRTLKELREEGLARPATESWHRRVFNIAEPATA